MSSSKSKNLIIIMLLLLDIILMAIVAFDKAEDSEARQAEAEAIREVLGINGIDVDEDVEFNISAPVPCVITRDAVTEQALISKMIGPCSRSDLGGNIIFYESDNGQAVFRGNGELDVVFSGNHPKLGDTDGKAAAKYMGKCGLALDASSEELVDNGSGNDLVVSCALDGYCVYNAKLIFTLSNDEISMINGTRIFTGQRKQSDDSVMDSITAMMRFIEIVHGEGYICSRISNVEAGYFMNVSVSGECVLIPVWHIETDTGELYINAVSGKIETLTT